MPLNHRTRFMNCLRHLPVDRLPFIEIHGMPWCYSYTQRWDLQGIPDGSEPRLAFGFDCADAEPRAVQGFETVPIDWDMVPKWPVHEIPFDGKYIRWVDPRCGAIKKAIPSPDPDHPMQVRVVESPPHVRDRATWQRYQKRYRATPEGRYPDNWCEWIEHARTAEHPIMLNMQGLTGPVRGAIGDEGETGFFYSLFTNADFVHELADYFTEFLIAVADKALQEAPIDFVMLGDQIAGDDRPFLSPKLMETFFMDGYRRIIRHLRSRGVDLILYNADGNVRPFVSMLVEAGVDGFGGIPRQMDPVAMKDQYGDKICMIGGIDRWVLLKSKAEIEREVDAKIELAQRGRYIPCLCGGVLPETTLENYRHYAAYLREQITRCANNP